MNYERTWKFRVEICKIFTQQNYNLSIGREISLIRYFPNLLNVRFEKRERNVLMKIPKCSRAMSFFFHRFRFFGRNLQNELTQSIVRKGNWPENSQTSSSVFFFFFRLLLQHQAFYLMGPNSITLIISRSIWAQFDLNKLHQQMSHMW